MVTSGPGITDIKRLFSHSGNRCAFPKCKTPVFLEGALVAAVCHIRGEKAGSARYDPKQPPEERQAYANLVLMCATHHAVIDDDEVSYTVDRLLQIKAAHEAEATPIPDVEVTKIVQVYINTINVEAHAHTHERTARELKAIETIWSLMLGLQQQLSDVIFFDTIFTQQELTRFFCGSQRHPVFDAMRPYADPSVVVDKINKAKAADAPLERPFVGDHLYAYYTALQAVLARSAMLLSLSFKDRRFHNWRDDDLIDAYAKSVIPGSIVDELKKRGTYALHGLVEEIQKRFVAESRAHL
jgi:hypothetical protein